MQKTLLLFSIVISSFSMAQRIELTTIFEDKISIRAIELYSGKVWYAGTDSKFGFVDLQNPDNRKQIQLSDKKLQFRTLAQDKNYFYTINIESPAGFYKIDKKTLTPAVFYTDNDKKAFYDALISDDKEFYTFSDPEDNLKMKFLKFQFSSSTFHIENLGIHGPSLAKGEAAFAASNTNISTSNRYIWLATGGLVSRVFRWDKKKKIWEFYSTSMVHSKPSQGIYSMDFDGKFGIVVGGDYTEQTENNNNIATTNDYGQNWTIQASGKNEGYSTCVKIRPKSNGKEIIALGDNHISYSKDFGKTWTKISNEKGFYTCKWLDTTTLVLAGRNKIAKANFSN